jgi:hypothetical protein
VSYRLLLKGRDMKLLKEWRGCSKGVIYGLLKGRGDCAQGRDIWVAQGTW